MINRTMINTKPVGRPNSGVMVTAGQIPAEKSAESIPRQVPTMMAKKAATERDTTPTIIAARTRSGAEGSALSGLDITPGYRAGRDGILRGEK
jgi:hypothetical protein